MHIFAKYKKYKKIVFKVRKSKRWVGIRYMEPTFCRCVCGRIMIGLIGTSFKHFFCGYIVYSFKVLFGWWIKFIFHKMWSSLWSSLVWFSVLCCQIFICSTFFFIAFNERRRFELETFFYVQTKNCYIQFYIRCRKQTFTVCILELTLKIFDYNTLDFQHCQSVNRDY